MSWRRRARGSPSRAARRCGRSAGPRPRRRRRRGRVRGRRGARRTEEHAAHRRTARGDEARECVTAGGRGLAARTGRGLAPRAAVAGPPAKMTRFRRVVRQLVRKRLMARARLSTAARPPRSWAPRSVWENAIGTVRVSAAVVTRAPATCSAVPSSPPSPSGRSSTMRCPARRSPMSGRSVVAAAVTSASRSAPSTSMRMRRPASG